MQRCDTHEKLENRKLSPASACCSSAAPLCNLDLSEKNDFIVRIGAGTDMSYDKNVLWPLTFVVFGLRLSEEAADPVRGYSEGDPCCHLQSVDAYHLAILKETHKHTQTHTVQSMQWIFSPKGQIANNNTQCFVGNKAEKKYGKDSQKGNFCAPTYQK